MGAGQDASEGMWGWGDGFLLWSAPHHPLPHMHFVTCVLGLPQVFTLPVAICVAGVLPPEEAPCAAASGLAPRAERAPGSGEGSEAPRCGQQALPHQ